MQQKLPNLYSLLKTKDIISILDGDTDFGIIEVDKGVKIKIAMPYLKGSDLCALSTLFGLPVTYLWSGTNLSRWEYMKNILDHCIKLNKCSELLSYMFAKERFTN